ncbi:MAG: DUF4249 domain-containing protein [Microscillaceae bacterium]|nr:DUF4249 domain-containing protein [Microscillaceae bacterium]MDW8461886.1 DUF4249 domain-containing protein [Cytophagales bacterium]
MLKSILIPKIRLILTSVGVALFACRNLERTIEFELPPYRSQLVVECYLEVGKPYQLLLTESVSYFAPPELPRLLNALVTITHQGKKDTLFPEVKRDTTVNKIYTHTAKNVITAWNEDEYLLEIRDNKGRYLTARTRFLPPPRIDTAYAQFRTQPDTTAFLLVRFFDNDSNKDNFYRLVVNKRNLKGSREIDFAWQPRIITDGKISIGTSYRFKKGDTLLISLYHIEQSYLDFIRTVSDANQANGNPFAQPTVIRSNVQGGLGIFTALSYDRRTLVLKK